MKNIICISLLLSLSNALYGACVGASADISSPGFHAVSGIVTVIDNNTIQIEDFNFDGGGPDVYIILGVTDSYNDYSGASLTRVILIDGVAPQGMSDNIDGHINGFNYFNEDLVITLPAGKSMENYNGISIWCDAVGVGFGQGPFVQLVVPNLVGMTQANAETALVDTGYGVGVITPQYSEVVVVGNVISQSEVAGSTIACGTAVNLSVSLGPCVLQFDTNNDCVMNLLDLANIASLWITDCYVSPGAAGCS